VNPQEAGDKLQMFLRTNGITGVGVFECDGTRIFVNVGLDSLRLGGAAALIDNHARKNQIIEELKAAGVTSLCDYLKPPKNSADSPVPTAGSSES
jgi:hypothetical protein